MTNGQTNTVETSQAGLDPQLAKFRKEKTKEACDNGTDNHTYVLSDQISAVLGPCVTKYLFFTARSAGKGGWKVYLWHMWAYNCPVAR